MLNANKKPIIVQLLANFFERSFKVFFLSPILTNAPLAISRHLLDLMEGLSSIKIMVKPVQPGTKKVANFIYFSVFNMKAGRIRRLPLICEREARNAGVIRSFEDPLDLYSPDPSVRRAANEYLSGSVHHRGANSVPKRCKNLYNPSVNDGGEISRKRGRSKIAVTQLLDEAMSSDEIIDAEFQPTLKYHVPISKNTNQVIEELNKRVLELELDNNKLKYVYKNAIRDLNGKLAHSYQVVQAFEQEASRQELLDIHNKEIRRLEKQVQALRNTLIRIISSHEMAYASLAQHIKISRKEQLLLNELKTLQKSARQAMTEAKTKELENAALKVKDRVWAAEHKELEIAQKDATMCKKKLVRTENIAQSTGAAKESSDRTAAYLKKQYDALEVKNRENEKLIFALQKQIDRMNIKLSEGKIAEQLEETKTAKELSIIESSGNNKHFRRLFALLVDKSKLSELHAQAMKCKAQIKEDLRAVRTEAKAYNCANLNLVADSLKENVNLLLDALTKLELRELRYVDKLPQIKIRARKNS